MTQPTDTVKQPTKQTLRRYGLTLEAWMAMWDSQGGLCPICLRHMPKPCVDHKHLKGWATFAAPRRAKTVRGLLCWRCNRLVIGPERFGVTPEILRRAADYLERAQWAQDESRELPPSRGQPESLASSRPEQSKVFT